MLATSSVTKSERGDLGIIRGYPQGLVELAQLRKRLLTEESMPGAGTLALGLITGPSHRWGRQEARE
jgi:hypothetical protein